ncbi:MAG: DUF4406 domain-containing protein [Bacteroidales bacterium]|nr:DUF4406 domain-containing protein [Bacteroidales bacterium]
MNKETFSLITTKVTLVTGITEAEMTGKSRKGGIMEAKRIARYLCVRNGMNVTHVASFFNISHGSVSSGVKTMENLMFTDRKFREKIEKNYSDYLIKRVRKPVYIIGKVTGEPYRKCLDKFEQREKQLNEAGFMAINPMKLVPPETPWTEAMRICIASLVQCYAVSPLCGWNHSKGANLEMNIAKQLDLAIMP